MDAISEANVVVCEAHAVLEPNELKVSGVRKYLGSGLT
jgi:hypothetical protein